ncbi:MAG: aspartate kinase, partial [Bacteroidales bacterium]|nr:aspartate kinase [Bacteroidales bacterium]
MKVFKFGGASVNSADAVRNMAHIVETHLESDPLVVVVSAMGKTTNLLEKLVPASTTQAASQRQELRHQLEDYHLEIANRLIPNDEELIGKVQDLLHRLDETIASLQPLPEHYNYNYDQVVSFGELISTTIIAHYLNHHGINTQWIDARQIVTTDNHFREGRVDWEATCGECNRFADLASGHQVAITQGFIGATSDMKTTTLGREGSDYSAAILAYGLGAESVTIWKDVPGFLNADPKFFPDTVKISEIPYDEAIELAYYGASV